MSLWGGIASAVGSIVGAGASYLGSQARANAAEDAQGQSLAIYQQQRKDAEPFRRVGGQALNQLRDIYLTGERDYTTSPGYEFRLGEGQKALERSAAARGGQLSGAQLKATERFAQDYATNDYDQNFNRLSSLAGYGGQALQANNASGANFAANYGTTAMNAGKARASGYEGIGSSINSNINNMLFLQAMKDKF